MIYWMWDVATRRGFIWRKCRLTWPRLAGGPEAAALPLIVAELQARCEGSSQLCRTFKSGSDTAWLNSRAV